MGVKLNGLVRRVGSGKRDREQDESAVGTVRRK